LRTVDRGIPSLLTGVEVVANRGSANVSPKLKVVSSAGKRRGRRGASDRRGEGKREPGALCIRLVYKSQEKKKVPAAGVWEKGLTRGKTATKGGKKVLDTRKGSRLRHKQRDISPVPSNS